MFFVIGLIITVNAFILLSGRLYLYKGMANTYLAGRTGPSIYDLKVFHNARLKAGDEKHEFPVHKQYNTQDISIDYRKYIEDLDTRALLVIKGDTLLYEEYWQEHNMHSLSNSFSIAKTVVAILIGIAVEEGEIGSLDDSASKYIPAYKNGGREEITVRHLLQMASGLSWQESGGNPLSDNAESYYGSDLPGLIGRQKRVTDPGTTFNYQSGNSQLLGFILEKATGKSVSKYAEEKLWSKLGMQSDAYWSLDKKNGKEKAFCCLYATARDFARIGKLLLDKGMFNGEQIIPRWYYDEMVQPGPLGTEEGVENTRYGLHIWTYLGGETPAYYCRGIRGQYIITIPEENLLIVRLGRKRKPDFDLPKDRKNDRVYIEENKHKFGHCLGVFEYIALGKMIASQTED
ncbi:MAG: serine hydrolase [Crocinitomicaceae bacterium]|nr:serine hydrolase [Crocinitomicaceae bacterium]